MRSILLFSLCLAFIGLMSSSCSTDRAGEEGSVTVTVQDYQRAERMLSSFTSGLITGATVRPVWVDDKHFWYMSNGENGPEFLLVDASSGEKSPAFDHKGVARALSGISGEKSRSNALPLRSFEYINDMAGIRFVSGGVTYNCKLDGSEMKKEEVNMPAKRSVISPDGSYAAFIKDFNLWIMDRRRGEEKQLTFDGEPV